MANTHRVPDRPCIPAHSSNLYPSPRELTSRDSMLCAWTLESKSRLQIPAPSAVRFVRSRPSPVESHILVLGVRNEQVIPLAAPRASCAGSVGQISQSARNWSALLGISLSILIAQSSRDKLHPATLTRAFAGKKRKKAGLLIRRTTCPTTGEAKRRHGFQRTTDVQRGRQRGREVL